MSGTTLVVAPFGAKCVKRKFPAPHVDRHVSQKPLSGPTPDGPGNPLGCWIFIPCGLTMSYHWPKPPPRDSRYAYEPSDAIANADGCHCGCTTVGSSATTPSVAFALPIAPGEKADPRSSNQTLPSGPAASSWGCAA